MGAIALVIPTFSAAFHQEISLLRFLPNVAKWLLLLALTLGLPLEYRSRENRIRKNHVKVFKAILYSLLGIVYLDRLLLGLFFRGLVVAAMDANPEPLLDSMLYMAIKSQKIWLGGILGTLEVSLVGTVVGFLLAILLVFLRVNVPDKRDSDGVQLMKLVGGTLERAYVAIVRGTPMMVQACVIYYGGFFIAKAWMPGATITEINQAWSVFTAGFITVSLNTAAYLSEVLRGGIDALDKGQREAAMSLGFTLWQSMTRVIFPQAVRNALPSIGNELVNNIKGSSVLNIIGFVELMFATGTVAGFYYKYLASYCVAALIYLVMTAIMTGILNALAMRMGRTKTNIPAR